MSHDIPPVIRRDWNRVDSESDVFHTLKDDTSFERGLGDHGKVVEHVEYDAGCPCCGHDEMVRLTHVNIDARDTVAYWCLMPNCRYFVADELTWATKPHPNFVPDTPMEWSNTARCPDCEKRHTVVVTKDSRRHNRLNKQDGDILSEQCENCLEDQRGVA